MPSWNGPEVIFCVKRGKSKFLVEHFLMGILSRSWSFRIRTWNKNAKLYILCHGVLCEKWMSKSAFWLLWILGSIKQKSIQAPDVSTGLFSIPRRVFLQIWLYVTKRPFDDTHQLVPFCKKMLSLVTKETHCQSLVSLACFYKEATLCFEIYTWPNLARLLHGVVTYFMAA